LASPGVALFKPVTHELFADLGEDWAAYAPIYDPKTKLTPAQERRLMALAKFVSTAEDAQFAAGIGDLIDVPEFARFLAGQSLLANYDSILSNGQNFLLYLDPRTDRFGFIPWDHDHCWGQFPYIGSAADRAHASVRRPWVGQNRFLERMLAVPAVRQQYEAELKRLRETLFVPERLDRRLDEMAAVVRPWIAEESSDRLKRFEEAVGEKKMDLSAHPLASGWERPSLPLKQFFAERAASVSDQLEGRTEGVVPERNRPR
jgi:spore coat protein H